VRLVIARCSVDYVGRLQAHLPEALRLILVKGDGSVSIHADDRAYKPLNWMSPPCTLTEVEDLWVVTNRAGEELRITLTEIVDDRSFELGVDPGLVKDGVESHLQELLSERVHVFGDGWSLVRREWPTDIGPVDLMCTDSEGRHIAVEIKRKGEIASVEQITRYVDRLSLDPLLVSIRGVLCATAITPQARVLAESRGIDIVVVDYDELRGIVSDRLSLF
jgi:RecB family endonuclease NucS